jgi:translocation and assembly module TamB
VTTKWQRRLKRSLVAGFLAALALALFLLFLSVTGLDERWARRLVVSRIEEMTGARVELRAFHFRVSGLRVELDDLTLHGREPEGLPPFVHVDRVRAGIRILSLLGRKISLDNVEIDRPAVVVRIDESGHSNVPSPAVHSTSRPWREQLFDLAIRHLRLNDGYVLFNDARVPLAVEGDNLRFTLQFDAQAPGSETYVGALRWQQMVVAAQRYLPFTSSLSVKFTLARDAFSLDELVWKLPDSEINVRAELPSIRQPDWKFHYRGRVGLLDVRKLLRKPNSPGGDVDFSGQGEYRVGEWTANGHYAAHQISLPYRWFHAKGIESTGRFEVAKETLQLPQFEARVLGGTLEGRMEMEFRNLQFRVDSRERGASLAAVLNAVDNPNLPVNTLHWDGIVDVDSVSTWTADFKHFRSNGQSRWAPPAETAAGMIPVTALLNFDYLMDRRGAQLTQSQITTPTSHIEMDGLLSAVDSTLEASLEANNLLDWDDFINRLRGTDAEPRRVAGRAIWRGRVLGPLGGPTFAGHVQSYDARYDRLAWDEIEGDMNYSPDEFRLEHAHVRRGRSTASLDLQLKFDGAWSFLPENPWHIGVKLDHAPLDDVQGLFGTDYPAGGLLTGEFRGDGTRAAPTFDGDFELADVSAWGIKAGLFHGQLGLSHDEIRVTHVEIQKQSARVTGDFRYRFQTKEVEFALAGAQISLDQIDQLQMSSLPLGGDFSFHLSGKGPLLTPQMQGTFHLVKLRIGDEVQGDLEGQLESDGQHARLQFASAMPTGSMKGQFELTLSGDYPMTGDLTVEKVDLDPFIKSGLHLKALTGHSSVDGHFTLASALRRPGSLEIHADISRVSLNYEFVNLQNVDPVRLVYRRDEVRIEEAHLQGSNTDFRFSGYARFAGDRALSLKLAGSVNLQLASGLFPRLEATGAAQVDAQIEGTYSSPRIIGRVHVADAAMRYGDFPAGLSHVKGDFVFDSTRLFFDNVNAEAGGGVLRLGGSLTYGEGPLRYEVTANANRIRIRYPEGMSWQTSGTLRLSGTRQAGVLSGHIVVDRLLLGSGVDLSTLIVTSREPVHGPSTSSEFLRNLQFDIQTDSGPDARIQWSGANLLTEGSLRVRGTLEHPILLGHVHLLAGEMNFRGNRYTLSRGDINFSNPFRLDPVLNVEATATIQQYEITLDFTGPASHLSLAYRSDPPLPSSDIIALLALGTTSEESALRSSGSTQSQNFGATALLSEAISSQLGGRVERLFGISRFRVDPFLAGTSTEQNAAARITIEQQVTHDLTITYSTNATSNQQQVIQVEYAIRRDVSIVALRDINGTFGLDVKFKKRFK